MAMTEAEKNVATIWEIVTENIRLRAKVDELQARGSALVLKMQGMNPYGDRDNRQRTVLDWAKRTFGKSTQTVHERALRLAEEAIEVAQSAGITYDDVLRLMTRVYNRPVGELKSEIAGASLCLLGLAEAAGASLADLEAREIERLFSTDPAYFQERQLKKAREGLGEMPECNKNGFASVEP